MSLAKPASPVFSTAAACSTERSPTLSSSAAFRLGRYLGHLAYFRPPDRQRRQPLRHHRPLRLVEVPSPKVHTDHKRKRVVAVVCLGGNLGPGLLRRPPPIAPVKDPSHHKERPARARRSPSRPP